MDVLNSLNEEKECVTKIAKRFNISKSQVTIVDSAALEEHKKLLTKNRPSNKHNKILCPPLPEVCRGPLKRHDSFLCMASNTCN